MYPCGFCTDSIPKGQWSVSCVLCKKDFHISCAVKSNAKVTANEVENMKNKKAGLVYRCGVCTKNPPSVQSDSLQLILEKLAGIEASNKYVAEKLVALEVKVDDAVKQLAEVKSNVTTCTEKVEKLEKDATQKFSSLEQENDELRRLINRCDIVVNGIPSSISDEDMRNVILNIGKKYCDDFDKHDVTFCSFINRKKSVLLKVSNTGKRDQIMQKYRADYNLKVSDVMDLAINSRIYLNDNYTKLESKVRFVCRSLQRAKAIGRFKISYGGGLKIIVFGANGHEKELCVAKILAYDEKKLSQAELLSDK